MPVRIPDNLPARKILEEENVFVMAQSRACQQDIRPLRIAIVNLMPTKILTETQIIRLLSNSPLQVELSLIRMGSHESRNTPSEHLESFYEPFEGFLSESFDGLIITGAPVETLEFEEVDYWDELCRVMEWSKSHVWSTLHICWGAQAGLHYHYGVNKQPLERKCFGLFEHRIVESRHPLVRGFDELFLAPHSRYTDVPLDSIKGIEGLDTLSVSDEAGLYMAASRDGRLVFVTGHPEYDRFTLKAEYDRDRVKGLDTALPRRYYPMDDPSRTPCFSWRAHAHLLYTNWLNYCVYQETPFDLAAISQQPTMKA